MEMKGECNCGAVTAIFRFPDGQQLSSILCHCINCKKSSGSIGSNFMIVPREALSVEGQLTTYLDNSFVRTAIFSIPIPPMAHTYLEEAPSWMPRVEGTALYKRGFGGNQV
ncbi:Mss4-like protein [Ilyonectria robusta]|uniref:Mss4-like protein n=1 Tax=Ilyonectria robusta TaxID=1079257 RepID=UPI001E8CF5AA|nr:Mss4-like protein [Ilyonectria robusta]KAH8647409.1 Mss4-like protein [Ilyonectria robusta]